MIANQQLSLKMLVEIPKAVSITLTQYRGISYIDLISANASGQLDLDIHTASKAYSR